MEKRRSGGVTFWAWTFIIMNLIGLLTVPGMTQVYSFLSKSVLAWIVLYGVVSSVVGIIAGINLLRLKEWARRAVIIMVFLNFFEMIFLVPFNHRYASNVAQEPKTIAMYEKQYDATEAEIKAKASLSKEEFIKLMTKAAIKMAGVFTGILESIMAAYLFLILWFFTKLNVRRQFELK